MRCRAIYFVVMWFLFPQFVSAVHNNECQKGELSEINRKSETSEFSLKVYCDFLVDKSAVPNLESEGGDGEKIMKMTLPGFAPCNSPFRGMKVVLVRRIASL